MKQNLSTRDISILKLVLFDKSNQLHRQISEGEQYLRPEYDAINQIYANLKYDRPRKTAKATKTMPKPGQKPPPQTI